MVEPHNAWAHRVLVISEVNVSFLLWLAAVALVVVGIIFLFRDRVLLGIILIVLGFLVGPGGYSIFRSGRSRRL
jgi:hypothetical protein